MMSALAEYRHFFADEIEACAGLKTPRLVDAFATVERERFLRPGPWLTKSEADFGGPPRQTPDADPRRVYHNIVVAIDPARQLFNGQPSTLGLWIDALAIRPGARVLHVGAGLGYYSAVLAHTAGPDGRVLAIEVDPALAAEAAVNLRPFSNVELRHGDATGPLGDRFDAILVNAGVTHPRPEWLDALAPGGRMAIPLSVPLQPGSPVGKGFAVLIAPESDGSLAARVLSMVMIYSAEAVRDQAMNERLGKAFARSLFPPIKRLRRDPHDESPSCWLHGDGFCLSS